MGEDARWVCHTCITICPRGGRPIFEGLPGGLTVSDIQSYKKDIDQFSQVFTLQGKDSMISFLDDLQAWLSRHEGHDIHIGSDYSTDMMDLEDYHNETVDGKVSPVSRIDAQMLSVSEWEKATIDDIKTVLMSHKLTGKKEALDAAARELYNRFSIRNL